MGEHHGEGTYGGNMGCYYCRFLQYYWGLLGDRILCVDCSLIDMLSSLATCHFPCTFFKTAPCELRSSGSSLLWIGRLFIRWWPLYSRMQVTFGLCCHISITFWVLETGVYQLLKRRQEILFMCNH